MLVLWISEILEVHFTHYVTIIGHWGGVLTTFPIVPKRYLMINVDSRDSELHLESLNAIVGLKPVS